MVNDRTKSLWISRQWEAWMEWACGQVKLPASGFIRSQKSEAAKVAHGSSSTPSSSMMEFCCSTMGTLALLSRWANTLNEKARNSAQNLLKNIIDHCLEPGPGKLVLVPGHGDHWPASPLAADSKSMDLYENKVNLKELAEICEDLKAELRLKGVRADNALAPD
eukprot:4192390-Lingulodinium_polyedra.AAC.2